MEMSYNDASLSRYPLCKVLYNRISYSLVLVFFSREP